MPTATISTYGFPAIRMERAQIHPKYAVDPELINTPELRSGKAIITTRTIELHKIFPSAPPAPAGHTITCLDEPQLSQTGFKFVYAFQASVNEQLNRV